MKFTIDTAVINRNVQSISLKLKLKLQSVKKQATLIGEVVFLLGKACYLKMFHAQIVTTSVIDVDGFLNVYELEGVPSVTAGLVRLHYRQTVNGYVKARTSVLVTDAQWNLLSRRAAFGVGRLTSMA
ncbi:hypothetical protein PVE_P0266 (plasmid) [Pseudomonas veronii 1YdBTEX2]|uniref:Uncharacterized protein n=2 Tax=Pseudomonas veronii TaxID=76761 RepID=A0A7Y1AB17_PSEVE|nr:MULTISPECIES: hypothetical protein [Pseudomonas]SBW85306.1 hypothetical protein PVE_P0266 [Pseudomonas veronii 1YdBTEX2]KAA0945920.1 hypothetical protein FQ186_27725 [Pseudomonas sp. ANT_H14]KAA0946250.1 hypothetical protein FQ182_13795 [Pseudomonas sp. ANT_H4]MBI6557351.1 hypothetical protein [Pseudomonas veronii]MBI6653579.1 hypothetical protein [Pseudomonas veronii]